MTSSRNLFKSSKKETVLAIIPARGGSKGVPKKNTRLLCGKPLIAYTIETALKSKTINHVVVSTEDEEIAEVSKAFGAQVPFLRPGHMAGDHSNLGPVIDHAVERMRKQGVRADMVATLYPTSPFRTPAIVDYLVTKMIEGFSSVRTMKTIQLQHPCFFARREAGRLDPVWDRGSPDRNGRPDRYYRSYGLFLGDSKLRSPYRPYLHIIKNPVSLVDIDAPEDFFLAEEIILNGFFDFGSEDIC